MPFRGPNPPSGASLLEGWLRKLASALQAGKILPGRGYKVKYTSQGTILEVEQQPGKGGGSFAKRFRVKAVFGAYVKCVAWDGSTEGETTWVAKPPEIRRSSSWTETVENVGLTYTYGTRANNADGQRVVTVSGGVTQTEIVTPVFHVAAGSDTAYSEIWADQPVGGTGVVGDGATGGLSEGVPITWLDDGREHRGWTQVA